MREPCPELEPRPAGSGPAARPAGADRPVHPRPARRARAAVANTVLCCAALHVLVLCAFAVRHRDASVFNVFTMLEAQRLWPALAGASAAPWWSFAALLALYGAIHGLLAWRAGRAQPHAAARRDAQPHRGAGWLRRAAAQVAAPAGIVAPGFARAWPAASAPAPALAPAVTAPVDSLFHFQPSLRSGALVLAGGLALHMAALAAIERFVRAFPPVPDVLHAHLPYVDFGPPGELVYAAFLLTLAVVLVRRQPRTVPGVLFLLGVFYGLRGLFLFLLPIGMPPTAPALEARFVLWPFAGHAYFPGGHTGMMTVLSFSVASRSWRRAFLVATLAFAFGTLLSRTHYTADALGGWCIGYAIVLWGRRHVVMRPASFTARRATSWSPAARHGQEV